MKIASSKFIIGNLVKALILCLLFLFFNNCGKKNVTADFNPVILKIGDIIILKEDFNRIVNSKNQLKENNGQSISNAVKACIYDAILYKIILGSGLHLDSNEIVELDYQNRKDYVEYIKNKALENIIVSEKSVLMELQRFENKQILVDYIWLPENEKKLTEDCFSYLNSNGNVVDMIYSEKQYFERIIRSKGDIRRINVKPGNFGPKISKFIAKATEGETKKFFINDGCYIIKIVYKRSDLFASYDFAEVEKNMKTSRFMKSNFNNYFFNLSAININLLDSSDLTVKSFSGDNKTAVKFNNNNISIDSLKKMIYYLPFNEKILFNNKSTMPSAVATLVLFNSKCLPVSMDDFIKDLDNSDIDPGNNDKKSIYSKYFEYQYFKEYSNTEFYPWVFPFLFPEFNKVFINHDLLYKENLVDFKNYDLEDTIAYDKDLTYFLSVKDFLLELSKITTFSMSKISKLENMKKAIEYLFYSTKNIEPGRIVINEDILKNVILEYVKKIEFTSFYPKRVRLPFNGDSILIKNNNFTLTMGEVNNLIDIYPYNSRLAYHSDVYNGNKCWRVDPLLKFIDDEIWIKYSEKNNLTDSTYLTVINQKNRQKLLLQKYLKNNKDIDFESCIAEFLKNNSFESEVQFWFDIDFFREYITLMEKISKSPAKEINFINN